MDTPEDAGKLRRIQRSRLRGSKLPANTKCVTRGTRWGNPFKVGDTSPGYYGVKLDAAHAVECFEGVIEAKREGGNLKEFLDPLRGLNLACWCRLCPKHRDGKPLGVRCKACPPCHADVLLKTANKK